MLASKPKIFRSAMLVGVFRVERYNGKYIVEFGAWKQLTAFQARRLGKWLLLAAAWIEAMN